MIKLDGFLFYYSINIVFFIIYDLGFIYDRKFFNFVVFYCKYLMNVLFFNYFFSFVKFDKKVFGLIEYMYFFILLKMLIFG